ncbi:hypothetical protein [Sphingobacterium sp. BN32]|nr:hypothetical protein [Sphingobacterium sp. BN32]WKK59486.1 hypothetical protein QYC40_04465 [Sphingobacterium sp. BN32]
MKENALIAAAFVETATAMKVFDLLTKQVKSKKGCPIISGSPYKLS